MTTSHLFFSSATQAHKWEGGRRGRMRRSKYTHLHTRTDKQAWNSRFDADLKRLLHWKPPILMGCFSGPGLWWEGEAGSTLPIRSHDTINHDYNQSKSLHTASMVLIYSKQSINYSASWPGSGPQTVSKVFTLRPHLWSQQTTRLNVKFIKESKWKKESKANATTAGKFTL